jgi:cytoskeletal protein RodZ
MPPVKDDDGGRQDWHDRQGVMWAAGAAAVALVGLLVFAVIRASDDSSRPPNFAPPDTSESTSEPSTWSTSTTSTSYTVPSVQTSEPDVPGPAPATTLPTDDSGPDTDTSTTSTTTSNPYNTTTPTNAGHV